MNNFSSVLSFHPWEYLLDELKERWISQTAFAKALWKPLKTINEIINAKKSITPELAYLFESALWISAFTWLWLQKTYELSKIKPKLEARYKSIKKNFWKILNTNYSHSNLLKTSVLIKLNPKA